MATDWLRNPLEARRELRAGIEHHLGGRLEKLPPGAMTVEPAADEAAPAMDFLSKRSQWPSKPTEQQVSRTPATVEVSTPAAVQSASVEAAAAVEVPDHPLVVQLRSWSIYQATSGEERDTWDKLAVPLVQFLATRNGQAPYADVAKALGYATYRVSGVLAELEERLNHQQEEILTAEREKDLVQLNLTRLAAVIGQG